MDDFPVALARQIEAACEHVARVILALTWVAIAVRPAVIITVAGVHATALVIPVTAVVVTLLDARGT